MEQPRAAGAGRREERDVEQALGDLAARFGVSRRTLNQAAITGQLPARRTGKIWLTTPAAVDAWLKAARHRPGRTPQRRVPRSTPARSSLAATSPTPA
jgi:excisionase family DNA binding protein